MRKLLVLSLMIAFTAGVAAQAEEPDTYSGRFLQQYTQKVTEFESKLIKEQEARNAEMEKKRQADNEAISKKIEELEKQRQESQSEFAKKIEAINKQAEENRAEINKKIEEQATAIEAARKEANEKSKARQEKIEKKKKLWKELISE